MIVLDDFNINYTYAGENIAKGQSSPSQVVKEWMGSSSHKANIENTNYSKTGVGVYEIDGTIYWVQLFSN